MTLLVQVQCAELGVGQFCPALRTVALTKNNEHWTLRMSLRGWRPNGKAIQSVSRGNHNVNMKDIGVDGLGTEEGIRKESPTSCGKVEQSRQS